MMTRRVESVCSSVVDGVAKSQRSAEITRTHTDTRGRAYTVNVALALHPLQPFVKPPHHILSVYTSHDDGRRGLMMM